jgi:hypothetical protein
MRSVDIVIAALAGSLALVVGAGAQPRSTVGDEERERMFVETLRREDPATAERYVTLRDARDQTLADLQRAQAQYNAAGPELRAGFVGRLREAQRQYARTSLALLDFIDMRDRRALTVYQEEINRINRVLEERARTRAELEKLLQPP